MNSSSFKLESIIDRLNHRIPSFQSKTRDRKTGNFTKYKHEVIGKNDFAKNYPR